MKVGVGVEEEVEVRKEKRKRKREKITHVMRFTTEKEAINTYAHSLFSLCTRQFVAFFFLDIQHHRLMVT